MRPINFMLGNLEMSINYYSSLEFWNLGMPPIIYMASKGLLN